MFYARKIVGICSFWLKTSVSVWCLVVKWCISVVSGVMLAYLWCLMEGGFIWLLVELWCICSVWWYVGLSLVVSGKRLINLVERMVYL